MKKNKGAVTYIFSEKSLANFEKNIDAYIKTMSAENIRPIIEKNANRYMVPAVRSAIPVGRSDHQYGSLSGRSKTNKSAFRILRGNMRKSYQVLTHRKKFRADKRVFVGPKAYFRKSSFAAVYGRNAKNTNAFYGPAREARFGATIGPAVRRVTPLLFAANARAIKSKMRP